MAAGGRRPARAARSAWANLPASARSPLSFPDSGSRTFSATSPAPNDAVVELLAQSGLRGRFRFDARVVSDAEPGLPGAFVMASALPGTVIDFRRHVVPRPTPQPAGG